MVGENGVPETPDWHFTPPADQPSASLPMPLLWQDQGDQG